MDREDGVPLADADRLLDDQGRAHPVLLDDPGPVERLDEDATRTVAAGALARVDLDDRIVDLESRQCGHHVLDHLHARAAAADRGAALGRDDRIDPRRDRGPAGQIGPLEHDPGVGLGRMEADGHVGAVEEPDSAHLGRRGRSCAADGSL